MMTKIKYKIFSHLMKWENFCYIIREKETSGTEQKCLIDLSRNVKRCIEKKEKSMYYTYILRCKDNSLYTGITTDLERRLKEHKEKGEKTAKYTLTHSAVKMEIAWESENRVLSSKLEFNIKKLAKKQKEELIKNPKLLNKFLGDKVESELYKVVGEE